MPFRSGRPLFSYGHFYGNEIHRVGRARFQPQKFIHRVAEVLLFESQPTETRWRAANEVEEDGIEKEVYNGVLDTYVARSCVHIDEK